VRADYPPRQVRWALSLRAPDALERSQRGGAHAARRVSSKACCFAEHIAILRWRVYARSTPPSRHATSMRKRRPVRRRDALAVRRRARRAARFVEGRVAHRHIASCATTSVSCDFGTLVSQRAARPNDADDEEPALGEQRPHRSRDSFSAASGCSCATLRGSRSPQHHRRREFLLYVTVYLY